MTISLADLQDFHRFATERVRTGAVSSLVELAAQWEVARREMQSTIADIHVSHSDIKAGRVSSVADSFADIHACIRAGLKDIEAGRYRPADDVMAEIGAKYGLE